MARAQAIPILVGSDTRRVVLERIHLGLGLHNEDWLQGLIHDHPETLPIAEIEPGFGELVPVAREVPCGHGYIDNLYVTPSGDIVLVETKLWRNTEIRREVVAQALDYVAALSAMSYDQFERAVARGLGAPSRLYDLIADHPEALEEARFVDAISMNLRRGRMLVMVLGDGIRTETEALAHLLQSHAGAHFTFALVELATWRNGNTGDILAVPNILARTVMIERGVVRMENAPVRIEPVPVSEAPRAQSISMADFWEKLGERNPALPSAIRSFLDALEPLGVYPDLKASLNLKADLPNRDRPVSFGYIQKNGQFWTNTASWNMPEPVWRPYLKTLASLIGAEVIQGSDSPYVAINGKSAPRIEQFLPAHQDAFVSAISTMIKALNEE